MLTQERWDSVNISGVRKQNSAQEIVIFEMWRNALSCLFLHSTRKVGDINVRLVYVNVRISRSDNTAAVAINFMMQGHLDIWVLLRLASNSLLFTSHSYYSCVHRRSPLNATFNVSRKTKTPGFYKMHFNVILTSKPSSKKWRVTFAFLTKFVMNL